MTQPESLTAFIRRLGLAADKRLGQHFLVSDAAISKIIGACEGYAGFLEIGPGPGVLTLPLTKLGQVVAIEADARMVNAAQARAPEARVLHGDALNVDWANLLLDLPRPCAIVSNMPYNITGPLLQRLETARPTISAAVLMMQKEVGAKILATAGDSSRGSISVVLQEGFTIERVAMVPPGAFMPPPKVESIVLKFVPRSSTVADGAKFRKFVSAGFAQPRKKLATCLRSVAESDNILSALAQIGRAPDIRAHQLKAEEWVKIYDELKPAGDRNSDQSQSR